MKLAAERPVANIWQVRTAYWAKNDSGAQMREMHHESPKQENVSSFTVPFTAVHIFSSSFLESRNLPDVFLEDL